LNLKQSSKINFYTANCFKLLVGILLTFLICAVFEINNNITLWISIGCFIVGISIGLLKYKTIGFYILSISLGFIIFYNSNNKPLITTNYTFLSQPAVIKGKVKSVLNKKIDTQKIIIDGDFYSRTLPTTYNTSILLTISGQFVKEVDIQIGDTIIVDAIIRPPREKVFEYDFDEVVYNRSIGTSWIGYSRNDKVFITKNANFIHNTINTCYSGISNQIDNIFSEQVAGFVKAVIFANKTGLSYEDRNRFSLVGVSHILALSGLHIGIISAIVLFFISIFRPNRWIKFIVFSVFVVLFVILTGLQPSAIRAGTMAIFFMLGRTMFRETNMLNIASMVLLGVIIFEPSLLYSVGFQMSLLSVLGIFLIYDVIRNNFINFVKNSISNYIISSIAITLSVSIIINPLIAYYFNTFSVISPLANILIVPIFSLCLIFAIISIILSFIYFPLGLIYGYVTELLTRLCFGITYIAADLKYSAIFDYSYLTLISIIISIGLIYIFISKNKRQFIFRLCVSVFVVFSIVNIIGNISSEKQNILKLYGKEKYCLLNIPLSDGSSFIWIADRKPNRKDNQKYYNDIGLVKFIQNSKINCIAINGNYGKEFAELNCGNMNIITLSHSQQRKLEKMYLNNKYIYQLE
jgi:competence protein ComEC